MGWNDHVEFREMECAKCGAVSDWEFWDDVGKQRYIGNIGVLLGVDAGKHGKCPDCGSTQGTPTNDDDE